MIVIALEVLGPFMMLHCIDHCLSRILIDVDMYSKLVKWFTVCFGLVCLVGVVVGRV